MSWLRECEWRLQIVTDGTDQSGQRKTITQLDVQYDGLLSIETAFFLEMIRFWSRFFFNWRVSRP